MESLSPAKLTELDINDTKNHKQTAKIEIAFTDWFLSAVVPFCHFLDGKKVIIGDNLASHFSEEVLSKYTEPNISFMSMPSNTSHMCQENFRRCYAPGRDLAVDEAMIEFDGRLAWKQYMPKKPVKWGIKLWCLCEATSVYCLAFTVYTGAETGVDAVTHDLGYRVVMKLMENYLNQNRHVYADNYFTSVSLAKDLLAEDTYLCGTTRAHRREYPNKLASAKLKPGESIKWTNDDGVMLVKWRDRRDVYMIATNDEGLDVVRH